MRPAGGLALEQCAGQSRKFLTHGARMPREPAGWEACPTVWGRHPVCQFGGIFSPAGNESSTRSAWHTGQGCPGHRQAGKPALQCGADILSAGSAASCRRQETRPAREAPGTRGRDAPATGRLGSLPHSWPTTAVRLRLASPRRCHVRWRNGPFPRHCALGASQTRGRERC